MVMKYAISVARMLQT